MLRPASFAFLVFSASLIAEAGAPVRSMLEIRQQNVVIQQWDLSCGAAALATLLTYQHSQPVSEKTVAEGLLRGTNPLLVKYRGGFSLLDLKRYADSRSLKSAAYSDVEPDDLEEFKPAIVPVNLSGYPHFVIYRGRAGGQVLLSDPAFGNRVLTAERFYKAWQGGIAFVVQARDGSPSTNNALLGQKSDLLFVHPSVVRNVSH